MSDLSEIGFYTLSNDRVEQASKTSPLWRCEMILTGECNFSCPYCRGIRGDIDPELDFKEAVGIVDLWLEDGLKNVRFSGGEPTTVSFLPELVHYGNMEGVDRIAVSTNGSADFSYYETLRECGVSDFSISLDGCCAQIGDKMAGGAEGTWEKVVSNIERLSTLTYVTVGMVFTEENIGRTVEHVQYADSLGVSDIRVVPSAQYGRALEDLSSLSEGLLDKYPILRYRIENLNRGRNVRTMREGDCSTCYLALDDMAVAGGYHFPCIIYMREGGDPIGKVGPSIREERAEWVSTHNSYEDPICREMCLDVCIDYNNKYKQLREDNDE